MDHKEEIRIANNLHHNIVGWSSDVYKLHGIELDKVRSLIIKAVPAGNENGKCPVCGTKASTRYCPSCGQRLWGWKEENDISEKGNPGNPSDAHICEPYG